MIDTILLGENIKTLKTIPSESVDCCVTSPPYYALRDYGCKGQIGLEKSPEIYIGRLTDVFEEVRRILKTDGTLWLNIGDSYSGSVKGSANYPENAQSYLQGTNRGSTQHPLPITIGAKPKDLIGIPWMLAFSLRNAGWYLRQDIIWAKPNPMPESVTDRCTKAHEYLFLLSKSQKYYFDYRAIQEKAKTENVSRGHAFGGNKYGRNDDVRFQVYSGKEWKPQTKNTQYDGQKPNSMHLRREEGLRNETYYVRNKRDVWTINVHPTKEAHFATFPPMLVQPCILAGCPEGGIVLDPFMGSGTTGMVARSLNRHYIGCEINPEYKAMAERRIATCEDLFNQ